MKTHSVLIIGCGSIGERHLRCFQNTERAQVCGCDTDEGLLCRIKEQYGVAVTADWKTAIRDSRFTAVVVATPAHLHVEMATTASEAGKHVLIEKPLSIDLEGTERLVEMRDRKGLIAVVGYIHRSIPALRSVRSFLDTGKFGEPLLVTAISGQHFPHHRPAYKEIYFANHKTGGGTIQDAMTHLINAVEWLVEPIDTVYCDAAHQLLQGVEVEDTVNLLARSGRTLINCSYNLFQAPNEVQFEVHAEGGSLKAVYHEQRWGTLALGEEDWSYHDASFKERDTLFVSQANDFMDEIEGGTTDLASLEEGIQTLRVNLAALESSRSGQPVSIS